jgi:hypothetical protein
MVKRILSNIMMIAITVFVTLSLQLAYMNYNREIQCKSITIRDKNRVDRLFLGIVKSDDGKDVPVISMFDQFKKGNTKISYDNSNSLKFSLSDNDDILRNLSVIKSDGSFYMDIYGKKIKDVPITGDKELQIHLSGDALKASLFKSNIIISILNSSNAIGKLRVVLSPLFAPDKTRTIVDESYEAKSTKNK